MESSRCVASPVGFLCLTAENEVITGLTRITEMPAEHDACPLLDKAVRELEEYFEGKRMAFDLPLSLHGTPFQKKVWQALMRIPYGETRTYGQIAEEIGKPKAARAVGGACHRNPVMIFVPCHRVIGANGSLTGFGGGMEMKEYLLRMEKPSPRRLC